MASRSVQFDVKVVSLKTAAVAAHKVNPFKVWVPPRAQSIQSSRTSTRETLNLSASSFYHFIAFWQENEYLISALDSNPAETIKATSTKSRKALITFIWGPYKSLLYLLDSSIVKAAAHAREAICTLKCSAHPKRFNRTNVHIQRTSNALYELTMYAFWSALPYVHIFCYRANHLSYTERIIRLES